VCGLVAGGEAPRREPRSRAAVAVSRVRLEAEEHEGPVVVLRLDLPEPRVDPLHADPVEAVAVAARELGRVFDVEQTARTCADTLTAASSGAPCS
jgi:hypothetical protein